MISSNVSAGYSPTHQFISFVEGSSSEAPNPDNYALHVISGDHDLNVLDGGDPTNGFAPWVSDVLVYPSSEYWESLLHADRVRPYFDLSISNYNTLRVPSAIHDYDLYVDSAKIYEDAVVDGTLTAETVRGKSATHAVIVNITGDTTLDNSQTGAIIHSDPSGSDAVISFPVSGEEGAVFNIVHAGLGSTTTLASDVKANGTKLSQRYSACTVYWNVDSWYAFGELI